MVPRVIKRHPPPAPLPFSAQAQKEHPLTPPSYDPNSSPESQLSQPWLVQRPWDSIDPIFDHDSPHLACNHPGSAAAAYIPVDAGDEITAVYWYWLHPTGPMAVWLAACGDSCEDVEPAELEWFKVAPSPTLLVLPPLSTLLSLTVPSSSLLSPTLPSPFPQHPRPPVTSPHKLTHPKNQIWHAALTDNGALGLASSTWYQKAFQNWDGQPATWPVAIPPRLKPGLYLIRHEIISLHVAYRPQWYPECAHLNVSGVGDAVPEEEFLYKFPGAYTEDGGLFPCFPLAPSSTTSRSGGEGVREGRRSKVY